MQPSNNAEHRHTFMLLQASIKSPSLAISATAVLSRERHKPEHVAVNWEGFRAQRDGAVYASNPHAAGSLNRSLWFKGWQDGDDGKLKPESTYDCYWIVDDVLTNSSQEGYQVFFGDPFEAIGVMQCEYPLRRHALQAIPSTEEVYRVKLARRHQMHSVRLLRPAKSA